MQAMMSLILTLCVISLAFAEQSPLFLWGSDSVAKPSLITVRDDEFVELVTPLLADKALVVFLEKDLSSKDFLRTNVADGKSCLPHLQDVSDKTYYAAVKNPVEVLHGMDKRIEFNTVDASGKLSKPLETAAGTINFVKFDEDQSLMRGSSLLLHDSIIANVTAPLGDNAIFMLTSAPSASSISQKRQRRQVSDNSQGYVFRDGANLLLYFTSLSITKEGSTTDLDIINMIVNSENSTSMSVTLNSKTGSPLTFEVTLAGGYFFMKNVTYNDIKLISSDVYAPTDFSYFCGNLTLNNGVSDNARALTLKWNSLQFQAPFGNTKNTSFAFGDAWHCVGFFTGGILSGLLIVALLLSITFIGVCWMMDINTMDRFDDPKGKTITINASD